MEDCEPNAILFSNLIALLSRSALKRKDKGRLNFPNMVPIKSLDWLSTDHTGHYAFGSRAIRVQIKQTITRRTILRITPSML